MPTRPSAWRMTRHVRMKNDGLMQCIFVALYNAVEVGTSRCKELISTRSINSTCCLFDYSMDSNNAFLAIHTAASHELPRGK